MKLKWLLPVLVALVLLQPVVQKKGSFDLTVKGGTGEVIIVSG
jgi:hypothetical protein